MADEQHRLREVSWMELFPWLGLIRAARLAFAPRMLILAALGLAATTAGWRVIGSMFSGSDQQAVKEEIQHFDVWPSQMLDPAPPPVSVTVLDPAISPAQEPWDILSAPFRHLFEVRKWNVSLTLFTYLLLCGLWAVIVWSLFGGAITRIAALWFAREDRLSLRRALFSWSVLKWPAYFGGPLFPLIGVLIAVIPVAILCILLKLDLGVLIVGLIWPLILACGFFLAILLVGLLFGWPLMWPTISTEGTDSFDALSRSYSYTYQRPLHYLFYAAVAGIIGMLAWVVVIIFANGVINYSYWAASWGSGGERMQDIRRYVEIPQSIPADAGSTITWGVGAIRFWVEVVKIIAVGFLFSYFWSAATYIYFLLRRSVDATEMDEVAVDEEPETYGLPPLASEPGSVPQVNESKPPDAGPTE
jgi:hypothetical protein